LQQQHGNRYAQQVVQHASQPATTVPVVQAKLMVGAAGDRYEREADSAARQMGAPPVASDGGGGTRVRPELEELEASISRARGGGQSLADRVLKPMEQAFGADFRRVRVHQGTESDELCRTIAARAFNVGDHVFVRNGEHVGNGSSGRHLLAHELAHVVQQRRPAAQSDDVIQAFWVRKGGAYRWVRDQAKKPGYVRTTEKRSTFKRPYAGGLH
jgi:hypothetical protein